VAWIQFVIETSSGPEAGCDSYPMGDPTARTTALPVGMEARYRPTGEEDEAVSKPVTLLLVEDDEIAIACVRRVFARHQPGYPIRVAHDGVEALELLRSVDPTGAVARPYLILLDLNMPRMNGIEFLHALRDDPALRDSIVFMLTTSDASRDMVAAYSHNIAGYLIKSRFDGAFASLTELVDNYCRNVEFPPPAGRIAA